MRPKSKLIFLVILSAVLCEIAELRLTEPLFQTQQKIQGEGPSNTSKHFFNITFDQFKQKYLKKYSSISQENYRRLIFERNLLQLNLHNSNPNKKYTKKPNAFLDVNQDEFKSVYTTIRPSDKNSRDVYGEMKKKKQCKIKQKQKHDKNQSLSSKKNKSSKEEQFSQAPEHNISEYTIKTEDNANLTNQNKVNTQRNLQSQPEILNLITFDRTVINKNNKQTSKTSVSSTIPKKNIYIDWTAYAGPVRYQGYCGACYALATVDTFAAHLAIYHYSFFIGLSVQQIIDCTTTGLTFGCNGGYLEGALTYIQMNGIVTERVYPYTSGNNGAAGPCKMQGGSFKLSSFSPNQQGSCLSVITQLYKGPVSAGISGYNLRFYDQGIFDDCTTKDPLDHAIMIIGYQSGIGWRIKNSWGSEWGNNGYGWIAENNTCWICNMTMAIII